jgi:hypothetical protein
MRKKHLAAGLFAVLVAIALAQPAKAEPITFVYEGTIDFFQDGLDFEAFLGETFTLEYTFESTWQDGLPGDPTLGDYVDSITSLVVSVGPNTYEPSRPIGFLIGNDYDRVGTSPEDFYQVATEEMIGPDIGGLPQSQFLLFLSDASAAAFPSDALPHTVRAALTRLRQQGFRIERVREDGVSRYRIAEDRKAA